MAEMEENVALHPHLLQEWESSTKQAGQAQEHYRVHFHKRKTARGMPEGPILNFSQGNKIQWFLGPYFTEASKAGGSEISAARWNQSLPQPWLTHRATANIKQKKADPLTQVGPSLEMDN